MPLRADQFAHYPYPTHVQTSGRAWDAFVKADDGIKTYTVTATTHEVSSSGQTQDRVYQFSYEKPYYARSAIVSGPGTGSVAVWHGGNIVKGHLGGLLSGLNLTIPENDPRAVDIRGKTIEAAFYPWMIAEAEASGKMSEGPGPTVAGVPTDAVTMIPTDPSKVRGLTKEALYLSKATHLPVEHLGWTGTEKVEDETFSDVQVNPALPFSTFEI